VPILLFGTYGGLVADRHEKRRILYCTQSGAGCWLSASVC